MGLLLPMLLLWTPGTWGSKLEPNGQHVCPGSSPSELQCCPGWRQKNQECTIPICEGPDACGKDEVCVKPGLCRCKPGFFGAQCSSRCPGQYWGPDCRETCPCHPWGQCEPATGVCQCQPDRWGRLCEFTCTCGPHGRCDAVTGSCRCDPGWWSSTCRRSCQCNPAARCDPATGACLCPPGWWGRRCNFRCNCHTSPCVQDSGRCTCLQGWWGHECKHRCECVRGHCSATSGQCTCPPGFQGARCELPCNPGHHGVQCSERCGHCKQNTTCSPVTGSCESCKPGWNGTQCKQSCLPGTFGESCSQECPRCRLGEPCHTETGQCQHCDPGWLGHKCENLCPSGTFGEGCSSTCPTCVQGTCDAVTGECVCSAGYWGTSCNSSCPSGFHGNNCSIPCQCQEGLCHPVSGACQLGRHGKNALIAGILVPLLLLLLGIACCACCRWVTRLDPKDRPARDGAALSRMKQQVWGALTSLGSALPCGSLSNYKLPWVTVSHHDPEVPFNHSFIEPPSAGWASDDSFSSDPDSGAEDEGHTYSVPPQEGMVPVAQEDSPEPSLPGGPFQPPEAEGTSTPFPIPRTSSLARAKRPSVSFAEGTKFTAQSCRSSGELSSPIRKPHRFSRGVQEAKESTDPEQTETDEDVPTASSTKEADISQHQVPPGGPAAAGCVDTCQSNTQESPGSVATIYMLAGTPQKPEGPVRSVFRRFGNFQKDQAEPKVKTAIAKPLRRALCRNQGSPGLSCGSASQSSGSPPSAMGSVGLRPEEASRRLGDGMENLETVQEPGSRSSPPPQGPQKQADEDGQEEPVYENVVLRSGPPQP